MSTSTQTLRFNLRKAGSGAFSRATGDIATRLGAMSQANASFVPIILPTYGMEGAVLTIVAEDNDASTSVAWNTILGPTSAGATAGDKPTTVRIFGQRGGFARGGARGRLSRPGGAYTKVAAKMTVDLNSSTNRRVLRSLSIADTGDHQGSIAVLAAFGATTAGVQQVVFMSRALDSQGRGLAMFEAEFNAYISGKTLVKVAFATVHAPTSGLVACIVHL